MCIYEWTQYADIICGPVVLVVYYFDNISTTNTYPSPQKNNMSPKEGTISKGNFIIIPTMKSSSRNRLSSPPLVRRKASKCWRIPLFQAPICGEFFTKGGEGWEKYAQLKNILQLNGVKHEKKSEVTDFLFMIKIRSTDCNKTLWAASFWCNITTGWIENALAYSDQTAEVTLRLERRDIPEKFRVFGTKTRLCRAPNTQCMDMYGIFTYIYHRN